MARTAAVVGTATATRNAVNRRQADKNAQAYTHAMNTAYAQQAPPPQQYYAPPQDQNYLPPEMESAPMGYAPSPEEEMITQLERLGNLKTLGLLTDEEFAVAKQKLLAG
jgi:hypothetical protein